VTTSLTAQDILRNQIPAPLLAFAPVRRLAHQLELRAVWRRAYNRVQAELETYSDRELLADLLPPRSDFPTLAAAAGDQAVAEFLRQHGEYREAWRPTRHTGGFHPAAV
jgi:hypothetical protein